MTRKEMIKELEEFLNRDSRPKLANSSHEAAGATIQGMQLLARLKGWIPPKQIPK